MTIERLQTLQDIQKFFANSGVEFYDSKTYCYHSGEAIKIARAKYEDKDIALVLAVDIANHPHDQRIHPSMKEWAVKNLIDDEKVLNRLRYSMITSKLHMCLLDALAQEFVAAIRV